MMAMTTEIRINTAMNTRMISSCFFSLIFFTTVPLMKSRVRVELEAITREDKVDMDADSTSTTTTAIRMEGRLESMVGLMAS